MHIPVWMNLTDGVGRESTHRTRSFLFAALATVTARLFHLDRFHFCENGTVSLNLPPVAQVVGSRATRSMHPQALAGFRRLLSAVVGEPFDVDNPFAWLTKTQIVERIAENGGADLIRHSRSCTRVRAGQPSTRIAGSAHSASIGASPFWRPDRPMRTRPRATKSISSPVRVLKVRIARWRSPMSALQR
jgi:hypothetical protein